VAQHFRTGQRYPIGLWRLGAVKFWERYAYYTMLTLLPLLLIGNKSRGGMGWTEPDALIFTGAYFGTVQITPFLCGFVTDRYLTLRRGVGIGLVLLATGHALMVVPHILPDIMNSVTGKEIASILRTGALPLGTIASNADLAAYGNATAALTHRLMGLSFYAAIAFIAIGNGFFKPNITLAVGRQSYHSDAQRDSGYTLFYMIINLGAALSGIVSGVLAERYGWNWAMTSALVGMIIAVAVARTWASSALTNLGDAKSTEKDANNSNVLAFSCYGAMFVMTACAFICLYSIIFDQSAGLAAVFIEQDFNRVVAGFTVPTTWALSLNAAFVVLLSPLIAMAWNRNRLMAASPPLTKFAAGFVITASACAIFWIVANWTAAGQKPTILWSVPYFFLLTLGEVFIGPVGESAISRQAPRRHQSLVMGCWFGAIGLGGFLAGLLGSAASTYGEAAVFMLTIIASLCAAVVLFVLSPWVERQPGRNR
jgi:proton-dependent oligopeptide transporter, POT family